MLWLFLPKNCAYFRPNNNLGSSKAQNAKALCLTGGPAPKWCPLAAHPLCVEIRSTGVSPKWSSEQVSLFFRFSFCTSHFASAMQSNFMDRCWTVVLPGTAAGFQLSALLAVFGPQRDPKTATSFECPRALAHKMTKNRLVFIYFGHSASTTFSSTLSPVSFDSLT